MSISNLEFKPGQPVFTIQNFVIVACAICSVSFSLFTWEANRVVNKLDNLVTAQTNNDKSDAVQERTIADLGGRVTTLEIHDADKDHRITILETIGVHSGQPNVSYPKAR